MSPELPAPLQSAEQVPLRRDERVLARCPVNGKERGQERSLFFGSARRLLRVEERGTRKGQEFPLWSGEWRPETDEPEVRNQKPEIRSTEATG